MNWDDLRIILAVRDGGTYAAAAASLRVDETAQAVLAWLRRCFAPFR